MLSKYRLTTTIKLILVLLFMFTLTINAKDKYVKNEILVQINEEVNTSVGAPPSKLTKRMDAIEKIANKHGGKSKLVSKRKNEFYVDSAKVKKSKKIHEKTIVKLSEITDGEMDVTMEALKHVDGVVFVEPNYIFEMDDFNVSESNPLSVDQWYLNQNNIKNAWDLFEETDLAKLRNVVVAVLDSGIDYNHEDLKDAMWVNPAEIPGNNIDDDGNGYTDDVHGANVLYKDSWAISAELTDPMDNHGHGTHVAGIIGAVNNDVGTIGIASGVQIMAIKCARADGTLTLDDIVKALDYARAKNAHVANMSFGGGADSQILKNALADLSVTTTLVASAGNDHMPVEMDVLNSCGMFGILPLPIFPAAYPWVLGVEASDSLGNLAGFSNCDPVPYSTLEYEVRLPGVSIMSTLPGNNYAAWNGTSMSAPIASSLAALIKAKQWDNADVFTNRMVQGQVANFASDFVAALTQLPTPDLKYLEHSIFDPNGDNDGIADAGEIVTLAMKIKNYWGAAKNVKLKVSPGFYIGGTSTFSPDDFVTIVDPNGENDSKTVDIPLIGSYTIGSNGIVTDEYGNITDVTIPIELNVSATAPNLHRAVFTVELEYMNAIDEMDTTVYTTGPQQFSFDLQNGIEKKGVISSDETWDAFSRIIVTAPLAVADGVTLTIEEGVEVRFAAEAFLKIQGKLIANGTKDNKILFTLNNNESFECYEAWNGLQFHTNDDTSNEISQLNYVIVEKTCYEAIIQYGDYVFNNSIIREAGYFPGYQTYNSTIGVYNNCLFEFGYQGLISAGFWMDDLILNNVLITNLNLARDISLNKEDINNIVIDIPSNYYEDRMVRLSTYNDTIEFDDLTTKLYVAGRRDLFSKFLRDYSDTFDPDDIRLSDSGDNDEMLSKTIPFPPNTTPAFLVNAEWLDSGDNVKTVLEVGETYTLRLTFNKEKMNVFIQPLVSFGSLYPYTDKQITGHWLDDDGNNLAQVWEAEYTVTTHSGSGINTLRVNGAQDTDMMYDAPLSESYQFSIIATGAQALNLQAIGGTGKVDLQWMQDDYEFVGGYNLYRGVVPDDVENYTKINQYPILELNYTDTAVLPGVTYYYVFRAILSDGSVSPASNIASATVLDNIAPVITHTPVAKVNPGSAAWISAIVTDNIAVGNVKIYYRTKGSANYIVANMAVNSSQYTYTIANSYFNEGVNVEYYIEATDNTGNIAKTPVYEIVVTSGDVAPIITQVANISVAENSGQFAVPLNISDPDGDSFTVSVSSSDGSILSVVNSSSTNITLLPQTNQYGTVTVTVTATNALVSNMSFNVTITHTDLLPTIDPISDIEKPKEFEDFIVPVYADDPDGDDIILSILNSNPRIIQASLQGSNVLISSLPYAVGESTITVTATANGKSVSRSFLVKVLPSDNGTDNVYTYQLNAGWNLVGFLPYSSTPTNLPTELQDNENVLIIWDYDADNAKWLGYSPDPTLSNDLLLREQVLTEISATEGVWIYCKKSILVTLINPPEPALTNHDIVIKSGWNLVSSPDGTSIDPASFTDATIIWAYEPGTGAWKYYSDDPAIIAEAEARNLERIQTLSGSEGFWVLQ